MNNICSEKPPTQPNDGDIWFNTLDQEFYIYDSERNHWMTSNNDDVIVNTIPHTEDDPDEAYHRAMGVL